MAQIEEIKQSFTNEIKKQNKKINSITKNYNILNDEYLSLLNILKDIDNRVIQLEKLHEMIRYNNIEGIIINEDEEIRRNQRNAKAKSSQNLIINKISIGSQDSKDNLIELKKHKTKGQDDNKSKEIKKREKATVEIVVKAIIKVMEKVIKKEIQMITLLKRIITITNINH